MGSVIPIYIYSSSFSLHGSAMPQRTNTFQRLITIMHSKLGEGWKVQESAMLRDSITGEMREVDVVATTSYGNYNISISVECRDHKRPADVTWVESMAKKHESLPTSKLVLWSRSGFTKAAITKAHALNVETVPQTNISDTPWTEIAKTLIGGFVRLLTPRLSPFIDVNLPDGTPYRLEDIATAMIYDASGKIVEAVPNIVARVQANAEFGSTLLDHAPIGSGDFYAELEPPAPWFVDSPDGNRVEIRRIGIGISTLMEQAALESASAEMEGKVATLFAAKTTTGHFELYIEESLDGANDAEAKHLPSSSK